MATGAAESSSKRQRIDGASNASMPYVQIGDMERVSKIALGCFAFGGDHTTGASNGAAFAKLHEGVWGKQDESDTFATVKLALDRGINFFDNAEMYGGGFAEEVTGRALKASGYARSAYFVATKVSESNLSAADVKAHCQASIDRLGCGHIDLYQLHWASRAAVKSKKYPERPLEREIPLEETLGALAELKAEGKIRNVGVCNFGVRDLQRALELNIVPIVSNQICYNLLWRGIEAEVVPFCQRNIIAILPWSPMGQGLLIGKFASADAVPAGRARSRLFCGAGPRARPQQRHGEAGCEAETFAAIAKCAWIAERLQTSLANVSLAWLRQKEAVGTVLMGARSVSQLERNLTSLDLTLEPVVCSLLADAGNEVLRRIGSENLDPYEDTEYMRIH